MTIRPAKSSDIALLAEFWYDQMALRSQKSKVIRLAPDARLKWESYAHGFLDKSNYFFFVAEHEGEVLGAVIAEIRENEIGLLPEKYTYIMYLIVDIHSPHRQTSFVGQLLDTVKASMKAKNIEHLKVSAYAAIPLEAAFWRGIGANLLEESFWITL